VFPIHLNVEVFKGSLMKTAMEQSDPCRYFTAMELRAMFQLDDPTHSQTQEQLHELHSKFRVSDRYLDAHLEFLHSLRICGVSDHDLLFSERKEVCEALVKLTAADASNGRKRTNKVGLSCNAVDCRLLGVHLPPPLS
jgi:hypothetical protein